ncbi:MAG: hypothetical protein QNJ98_13085 [Planctomycetota bacterium]|nr:hypothetical protein [Planctomycetota bacterium]
MADTYDTGLLPRTFFKAPRVPFDFRALALGILGYLVFWAGGLLLNAITSRDDINGSFLIWFASLFEAVPYIGPAVRGFFQNVFLIDLGSEEYTFWHQLLGGVWFFVIWAFFGQAIHRITSLRIARDEGLSLSQAIGFSIKNFRHVLVAPVIIVGAMAFFYFCNAFAGVLTSIPLAGGVLGLIFIPLAVISTLLILLIGLGGVFGLPLIGAAAAWECNGSLDAISRAFSYVFARPLQYFWNFFLIFLFAGVILLVGAWFNYTLAKSVGFGSWHDTQEVLIDAPERRSEDFSDLSGPAQDVQVSLEKKTERSGVLRAPGRGGDLRGGSFSRDFAAVTNAPWMFKLNAFIFWAFMNLIWLGVFGYAIYWLLGASTSIYADLRADVDGTEEDEIYLEEEEDAFDQLAEGGPTSESGVEVAEKAAEEATSESSDAEASADAESSDDSSDEGEGESKDA